MKEKKVQVSQDYLYEYLTGHDVKLVRIAELMGQTQGNVSAYFLHLSDNDGRPRRFGPAHIEKLNEALPVIASELRGCVMEFGSEHVRTNKWGKTYDPALIEPMKRVGNWLNLTTLTVRLLGWTKSRKQNTLVDSHSKVYGNISQEDVMRINAELLQVSSTLAGMEVEMPESSNSSSSSGN